MALRLSKHFCQQWQKYFNEAPPTVERVVRIMDQSKWLQRGRLLYEPDGTQYKLLSTYWHPQKMLVIKVDWMEEKIVAIITPETKGKSRRNEGRGAQNERPRARSRYRGRQRQAVVPRGAEV